MLRGVCIIVLISTLVGCIGREKRVSSDMIADTQNLFFSGVINVDDMTFTDCATSKTHLYDIGVQNSRVINAKINNVLQSSTRELYCKVKGHLFYDVEKDKNVFIIEDALSVSRLEECGKPILPGVYTSNNTYNRSYELVLRDDYTYILRLKGEDIESGTWGKVYEYEGVMMWHSTTEDEKRTRLFTIEYLINSSIITFYYDDNYLIFS